MQEKKDNINDTGDVNSDKSHQKLPKKISNSRYLDELKLLHIELVKMQDWVAHTKSRVIVIFEGRDAAGKGG